MFLQLFVSLGCNEISKSGNNVETLHETGKEQRVL